MSEKIQDISDFFKIDPGLKKLAETAELQCK